MLIAQLCRSVGTALRKVSEGIFDVLVFHIHTHEQAHVDIFRDYFLIKTKMAGVVVNR